IITGLVCVVFSDRGCTQERATSGSSYGKALASTLPHCKACPSFRSAVTGHGYRPAFTINPSTRVHYLCVSCQESGGCSLEGAFALCGHFQFRPVVVGCYHTEAGQFPCVLRDNSSKHSLIPSFVERLSDHTDLILYQSAAPDSLGAEGVEREGTPPR